MVAITERRQMPHSSWTCADCSRRQSSREGPQQHRHRHRHVGPGADRRATSCSTPPRHRRPPRCALSTKNSRTMKDSLFSVTIFLIVLVAWFGGGRDGPRIPLVFRYRNLGWSGHLVLRGVAMAVSSWPRWSHRLHATSYRCTAPVIGGRTVDRRVRSARLPRPYTPERFLPAS